MFLLRRKFFLGSSYKKKEDIPMDNWEDFLWKNKIIVELLIYIKNNVTIMFI